MKRKPKIEVVAHEWQPGYWWRLKGANGEIVCHSEHYTTRSNALRAAKRAKALMQEAEIVK